MAFQNPWGSTYLRQFIPFRSQQTNLKYEILMLNICSFFQVMETNHIFFVLKIFQTWYPQRNPPLSAQCSFTYGTYRCIVCIQTEKHLYSTTLKNTFTHLWCYSLMMMMMMQHAGS